MERLCCACGEPTSKNIKMDGDTFQVTIYMCGEHIEEARQRGINNVTVGVKLGEIHDFDSILKEFGLDA
jgi:hypothetical protein